MPSSTPGPSGSPRRKGASSNGGGTLLRLMARQSSLRRAFNTMLRKRRSASGIDDVTIQDYQEVLRPRLRDLSQRLSNGTFRFSALRPVAVPKNAGGYRPILVPTVEDRLVQRAVLRAVDKYARPQLDHLGSHAFIGGPGRGVGSAVEQVCGYLRDGRNQVLLLDIVKFFPSIDAARAIQNLVDLLPDPSLAPLLEQLQHWEVADLPALPEEKRHCFPGPSEGLPQGSVLSPTLANLYLRDFDANAAEQGFKIVRYADDLAVPCLTLEDARRAQDWIFRALAELKLTVHDFEARDTHGKSRLAKGWPISFEFLGVHISGTQSRLKRRPARRSIDNAKQVIVETLRPGLASPSGRTISKALLLPLRVARFVQAGFGR